MEGKGQATKSQTFFSIFKVTVGIGMFTIGPYMSTIGYLPGFLLLLGCYLMTWDLTAMLIRSHLANPKYPPSARNADKNQIIDTLTGSYALTFASENRKPGQHNNDNNGGGGGKKNVNEHKKVAGTYDRRLSDAALFDSGVAPSVAESGAQTARSGVSRLKERMSSVVPSELSVHSAAHAIHTFDPVTKEVKTRVEFDPGYPSLVGRTLGTTVFRPVFTVALCLSCAYSNLVYAIECGKFGQQIFPQKKYSYDYTVVLLGFAIQLPGMLLSGRIKKLSFVALFGVLLWIATAIGVVVVMMMYYASDERREKHAKEDIRSDQLYTGSVIDMFVYFAACTFAFANIKVIIPLHDAMHPSNQGDVFNKFYFKVITFFFLLYLVYSMLTYTTYGTEIDSGSSLRALDVDPTGIVLRCLLAASLQLSGPIYFVPLCEIIDNAAGVKSFLPYSAFDVADDAESDTCDWCDFLTGFMLRFLVTSAFVGFLVLVGSDSGSIVLSFGTATVINYTNIITPALLQLYTENQRKARERLMWRRSGRSGEEMTRGGGEGAPLLTRDKVQQIPSVTSSEKVRDANFMLHQSKATTIATNATSSTTNIVCTKHNHAYNNMTRLKPKKKSEDGTALESSNDDGDDDDEVSDTFTESEVPTGWRVLCHRPRTFRAWRALFYFLSGLTLAGSQFYNLYLELSSGNYPQ